MNERLKELAKQAGLVRNGDFGMKRWEGPRSDSISDQDLDKFAELIVRECAKLAVEHGCDRFTDTQIKEHFGVE